MKNWKPRLYRLALSWALCYVAYRVGGIVTKRFPEARPYLTFVAIAVFIYGMYGIWKRRSPFEVSFGRAKDFSRMVHEFQESSGFKCDYLLVGTPTTLMFDTTDDRVAFVSPDSIVEYPFTYILDWSRTRNPEAGVAADYCITLRLDDETRPVLITTPGWGTTIGTAAQADLWAEKLASLLGRSAPGSVLPAHP